MKWQQGDVVIRTIKNLPTDTDAVDNDVIQTSAHPHVLMGDFKIHKKEESIFFIVGKEGATLKHRKEGGHQSIALETGLYSVSQVIERNMFSGLKAPVQD